MTMESSLNALMAPLVGAHVFPDTAPFDTARPYIVWQQIGGRSIDFIDPTVPSKQNAVMQITAWADTRAAAKALILQIEAALIQATTLQARAVSASAADHDEDLKRYGARQDFSIWADR